MQYFTLIGYQPAEFPRVPDYADRFDVIVAGLGTTGSEAALLCAEQGLKTLGIEKLTGMGGQITFSSMLEEKAAFSGDAQKKEEAAARLADACSLSMVPARLYNFDRLAEACGLHALYEAVVVGVYTENGKIDGVQVLQYGKLTDYQAELFIDCTTDASLCRMAGCRITHGNCDERQMAFSKTVGYLSSPETPRGNWSAPVSMTKPSPEEYAANVMQLSALYPCSWEDRKRLVHQSCILGQRENGSVETVGTVSFRDALTHVPVRDPIFYAKFYCDTVSPDRDCSGEGDAYIRYRIIAGLNYCCLTTGVPLGSILTKKYPNLLVASKCFGVSHDALSGLRFCSSLTRAAEAAARTAYLAIKHGTDPRSVPYPELKAQMVRSGGFAEEFNVHIIDTASDREVRLYTQEEVIRALRTDIRQNDDVLDAVRSHRQDHSETALYPGIAYLTVMLRKEYADALFAAMEGEGRYAGNFAVALALADDKRCADVLLRILREPGGEFDPVIAETIPNRVKAIYLLGALGETRAIGPLLDLLEDGAEAFTADLPLYPLYSTRDDYRYFALMYAARALKKLIPLRPLAEYKARIESWNARSFALHARPRTADLSGNLKRITTGIF